MIEPAEVEDVKKLLADLVLRDYFAAQAIVGIVASQTWATGNYPVAAHKAYEMADAMMAARNGK